MKKITIGIIIILTIIAIRFLFSDFFNIHQIEVLKELVAENVYKAALIYVLIYIAATALSVPGASVLTIAGGILFGAVIATMLVNVGATAGAILIFLAARYLASDWFQKRFNIKKVNKELERNGSSYLLTLRLIPIFPFFLINIAAGLTKVRLRTFVWTTALGIIPGSFVYAYAGQTLGDITSASDIISWKIFLALTMLGLLALIPTIYRRHKNV